MDVRVLRADAVVAFADAHVEHAVLAERELRPEVDAARVPVIRDEQILHVDERLAIEAAAGERRRAFLLLALRVGQVDELVLRELRVHRDLEQAALADREHFRRSGDRLRVERAAADDAQLARPFSVISMSPFGRNARLHGVARPLNIGTTRTGAPMVSTTCAASGNGSEGGRWKSAGRWPLPAAALSSARGHLAAARSGGGAAARWRRRQRAQWPPPSRRGSSVELLSAS